MTSWPPRRLLLPLECHFGLREQQIQSREQKGAATLAPTRPTMVGDLGVNWVANLACQQHPGQAIFQDSKLDRSTSLDREFIDLLRSMRTQGSRVLGIQQEIPFGIVSVQLWAYGNTLLVASIIVLCMVYLHVHIFC